jgi:hypothetical protein
MRYRWRSFVVDVQEAADRFRVVSGVGTSGQGSSRAYNRQDRGGRIMGLAQSIGLRRSWPGFVGSVRHLVHVKTFEGMTDEMLAWQTERFTELAVDPATIKDDYVVPLRPEQVVEIAFDGLQSSRRYPGGVALRFARVLRYRDDKSAQHADTIDTVRPVDLSQSTHRVRWLAEAFQVGALGFDRVAGRDAA